MFNLIPIRPFRWDFLEIAEKPWPPLTGTFGEYLALSAEEHKTCLTRLSLHVSSSFWSWIILDYSPEASRKAFVFLAKARHESLRIELKTKQNLHPIIQHSTNSNRNKKITQRFNAFKFPLLQDIVLLPHNSEKLAVNRQIIKP